MKRPRSGATDRDLTRPAVSRDVAKRAGVSIATVSRALNGSANVRQETREAVLKAAAELNFVFNSAARALITRRFHAVGVIVPSLGNDVFVSAVSAFQRILRQAGYQVVLASSDYDIDAEYEEAAFLMRGGVDGLLLVGNIHDRALYEGAQRQKIAIVQSFSLSDSQYCVGFDNRAATLRATRYLIDLGHRVVAVVTGTRENNDRAGPRAEGVAMALREAGLTLDPAHDIVVSSGIVAGRAALRQLMASSASAAPTAIICGTDEIALGIINEANDYGIRIPQDLSVIGFNDSSFASVISPPLTTLRVDADLIGRLSAETLLALFRGETPLRTALVEPELIIRGTVAPPETSTGGTAGPRRFRPGS